MKSLGGQQNKKSRLRNQRGMALVETIPILVIFLVLIAYGFGFFGVVHTGIMNSIAARAYAFETFRNRNNLTFFRDQNTEDGRSHFLNMGSRMHTVNSEKKVGEFIEQGQFATTRPIAFGRETASTNTTESQHNERIFSIERRNRRGGLEVNPAWIMVGYGICINARCGDN